MSRKSKSYSKSPSASNASQRDKDINSLGKSAYSVHPPPMLLYSIELAYARQHKDQILELRMLLALGDQALQLGNYPLAHSYASDARHLAVTLEATDSECIAHCLLASAAAKQQRFSEALQSLALAREKLGSVTDPIIQYEVHLTSAEVMFGMGDLIATRQATDNALRVCAADDWHRQYLALRLAIATFVPGGDQAVAERYASQALEVAPTNDTRAEIFFVLGLMYFERGEEERGVECWQRMFNLLSDSRSPEVWYFHLRQVMADLEAHPDIAKRLKVPEWANTLLASPPKAVRDAQLARAAVNFLNPDIVRAVQKEWGDDKSFSQFLGREYQNGVGLNGKMDEATMVRLYRTAIEQLGSAIVNGQNPLIRTD